MYVWISVLGRLLLKVSSQMLLIVVFAVTGHSVFFEGGVTEGG